MFAVIGIFWPIILVLFVALIIWFKVSGMYDATNDI
jgi:hypothetical protein